MQLCVVNTDTVTGIQRPHSQMQNQHRENRKLRKNHIMNTVHVSTMIGKVYDTVSMTNVFEQTNHPKNVPGRLYPKLTQHIYKKR